MTEPKRLFLFAGYDKDGIIDDALVFYIKKLANLGDVILCMDSDCSISELNKVNKYTITRIGKRHSEYDFGSYKRAYEYAKQHDILKDYDFVYMVNDSVYGPLCDLKPVLKKMESFNTDVTGMTESVHTRYRHIQSWFIGMRPSVFLSQWFDKFITGVKRVNDKIMVTILYENKFTELVDENHLTWACPFQCPGRSVYNKPKKLFKQGCPFIKKVSFTRHNGAIGHQLNYILSHCDKTARISILNAANHAYTAKYMSWLLTTNPITAIIRGITYAFHKARTQI